MTQAPEEFLAIWTDSYIKADPRDRGALSAAVALCIEDANRLGISEKILSEGAGGDLSAHLTKSVA
jgi:hypothetical protein